jgi:hypothetical protein
MKRKCILCLVLLLAGIFSAQLFGAEFLGTYGFLNEYYLKAFARANPDKLDLFWNILWERGKLFLVFALLAATPLRRWLRPFFLGIFSYLTGFYGAACLICQQLLGIGIFTLSLLPHGLLYAGALWFFLRLEPPALYCGKKYIFTYILAIVIVILLFLIGCILETAVSSPLLQNLLDHAFISAIS